MCSKNGSNPFRLRQSSCSSRCKSCVQGMGGGFPPAVISRSTATPTHPVPCACTPSAPRHTPRTPPASPPTSANALAHIPPLAHGLPPAQAALHEALQHRRHPLTQRTDLSAFISPALLVTSIPAGHAVCRGPPAGPSRPGPVCEGIPPHGPAPLDTDREGRVLQRSCT